MNHVALPGTSTEALELLKMDKQYAYLADKSALKYIMTSTEFCTEFLIASESFNPTGLAFMVQKGAPFVSQLSQV